MRGMIVRDFTPSLADAESGAFRFTNIPFWTNVSSGTLIVLANDSRVFLQSNFLVVIGLDNQTYFSRSDSLRTFDIAAQDMVMIKSSTASFSGTSGSIHAMAWGDFSGGSTATLGVLNSIQPFLWIPRQANGNQILVTPSSNLRYVYSRSTTSTIADFNGIGAANLGLWNNAPTSVQFGVGNTPTNQRFIDSLRQQVRTSVLMQTNTERMLCYPNPADQSITIALPNIPTSSAVTLVCANMLGLVLDQQLLPINNEAVRFHYPLQHLSQGAYILEVRQNGHILARTTFVKNP